MPDPVMTPVVSSNLHSVGRCDDGHLWVCFKDKAGQPGRTYRYDGAAEAHHDALVAAASPGSYFSTLIKGKHEGSRVDD